MATEPKTNFARTGGQKRVDAFYRPGEPTGNVFYVHNSGTTTGGGYAPSTAFSTISTAVAACTASQGDTVYVLPGHSESITAAAGVALSKAGVSVIGLGVGRARPVVTYTTATAASVDVTAANVLLQNIVLKPIGVDAVTAAVNVSAADFVMDGCELELADATNQAVLGVLTASGANRMVIKNCYFHGTTDAGTAAAVRIAAGSDIYLANNTFYGAYTTSLGAIDNSAAVVNLQVHGCKITNATASSTKAMVWHASTTGMWSDLRMGILSGTAPITAAAGTNGGGSYYSAAAGVTAATLI